MKKRYSIIAVVAAILAGGCSETIPSENDGNGLTGEITLSADLSGLRTITVVDGTNYTKVNWSADDALSVWGEDNNKFTLSGGEGTTRGSFTGTVSKGTAQYALYPYSSTATINEGIISANVPTVQTVPAASFDPAAAIMAGTISGETITFHHALAYLKITAPADVTDLAEITIESNGGVQLTGDAKFAAADGAFTATGTACEYVTVKPQGGKFIGSGIYYAAVIPGTYTGGLTVRYLYKPDATHLTEKTKSNSSALTTAAGTANTLAASSSFDHTYNAVQLWADGPYWATTNIGAVKSGNYGQYFAWGYTDGHTPSRQTFSTNFNTTNFPNRDAGSYQDAAASNWGTGWSVPTKDDFEKLINTTCYTSIEYVYSGSAHWSTYNVKGIVVTGITTGYTSNSIFLPAAGYGYDSDLSYAGYYGIYWSSDQISSIFAYRLYILPEFGSSVVSSSRKNYGYSVRPVRSSL